MTNLDRAKQFLPFDALEGYFTMVNNVEDIKDERIYLDDYALEMLEKTLSRVKKGDMVEIKHYENNRYIITCGLVSRLDYLERYIKVVKKKIIVDDIIECNIIPYNI